MFFFHHNLRSVSNLSSTARSLWCEKQFHIWLNACLYQGYCTRSLYWGTWIWGSSTIKRRTNNNQRTNVSRMDAWMEGGRAEDEAVDGEHRMSSTHKIPQQAQHTHCGSGSSELSVQPVDSRRLSTVSIHLLHVITIIAKR